MGRKWASALMLAAAAVIAKLKTISHVLTAAMGSNALILPMLHRILLRCIVHHNSVTEAAAVAAGTSMTL